MDTGEPSGNFKKEQKGIKFRNIMFALVIVIFYFFYSFFLFGFFFTNIHDARDSRGRGRVSI